ncbi:27072_t:CDS:2, partial [Racocetra persica]
IKDEIKNHFKEWTKENPTKNQSIEDPITMKELEQGIKEALLKKATGPQAIFNEMLKHIDLYTKNKILAILNSCINLQTIPKSWKKGNIYPISKKQ